MICRDIAEILDNRNVAKLASPERREAEEHIATCGDCARDWSIEGCLATLPDITPSADFRARCRALAAAPRLHTVPTKARRGVLVGTITALAAVAAMLALLYRPSTPESSAGGVPPATGTGMPGPVANKNTVAAVSSEAPAESPQLSALPEEPLLPLQFTVRVMLPSTAQSSESGSPSAGALALAEMTRSFSNDPARKLALESFHAALLRELSKVPGLTLVEADLAFTDPPSRHYQVRLGFSYTISPAGRIEPPEDGKVAISVAAAQKAPDGKPVSRLISGVMVDLQASCSTNTASERAACQDLPSATATAVRTLREKVFPPDPAVLRALRARLRDTSRDPAARFTALTELVKVYSDAFDKSLMRDPLVLGAVLDVAASADPKLRAQIWQAMSGAGAAGLIDPLMNSLQKDSDEVRLAAVATLAEFRDDPRVRSALGAAAVEDKRPLVRALANRSLLGEDSWRRYVVASLKDPSRPAAERVEALVYQLYPPTPPGRGSNPDYWGDLQRIIDDEAAVRALAEALPDAGRLQGYTALFLSNFGARSTDPAVTKMLLRFLEQDTQGRNRQAAGEVLARRHMNEPRVRDAVNKAMESDPDPQVRDWLKQVMGIKTP